MVISKEEIPFCFSGLDRVFPRKNANKMIVYIFSFVLVPDFQNHKNKQPSWQPSRTIIILNNKARNRILCVIVLVSDIIF